MLSLIWIGARFSLVTPFHNYAKATNCRFTSFHSLLKNHFHESVFCLSNFFNRAATYQTNAATDKNGNP